MAQMWKSVDGVAIVGTEFRSNESAWLPWDCAIAVSGQLGLVIQAGGSWSLPSASRHRVSGRTSFRLARERRESRPACERVLLWPLVFLDAERPALPRSPSSASTPIVGPTMRPAPATISSEASLPW